MTNHQIALEAKEMEREANRIGDKKLAFRAKKLWLKATRADFEESLGSYWRQSASQSVIDDYATGNVVTIHVP